MRTAVILVCLTGVALPAQQSGSLSPTLRFEVASVKPSPPPVGETIVSRPGSFEPGGKFLAQNATLWILLQRAFPEFAQPGRMVFPEWARSARFDIDARASGDAPIPQIRQMLRTLLIERFNMRSHTALTLVDTYDLVVARRDGRLGPRMRPATTICDAWRAGLAEGKDLPQPKQPEGSIRCGFQTGGENGVLKISIGGGAIGGLITLLQGSVGTSITDRTGLAGNFDMELSWATNDTLRVDAAQTAPTLATAIEDQLGLRLQPSKGQVEVLVIDQIERPTPN